MGRVVAADDSLQDKLTALAKAGIFQIGLLIGQVSAGATHTLLQVGCWGVKRRYRKPEQGYRIKEFISCILFSLPSSKVTSFTDAKVICIHSN